MASSDTDTAARPLRKLLIAEREAASCTSPAGRDDCLALLQHMRANARFALRQTDMPSRLPHGQEIKVQETVARGCLVRYDRRRRSR